MQLTRFYLYLLFISCIAGSTSVAAQQIKPSTLEINMPVSKAEDALCFQLQTITLSTANLDSAKRLFVQGMGMQLNGPVKLTTLQRKTLIQQWKLPASLDWQLYELSRAEVEETIRIRLLVCSKPTPLIQEGYQTRALGTFAIGFPNMNQTRLDQNLKALGFKSKTAIPNKQDEDMTNMPEAIYLGPDFVHYTSFDMNNGQQQPSAYDPATGLGGPSFATFVVTGMSDAMISFFRYVLGWEVRRDNELATGKNSVLGLEDGIRYRYTMVFAKGASNGHINLMDFRDGVKTGPKSKPKLPNRGVGMYTVFTKNLDEVKALAIQQKAAILSDIIAYEDPIHGRVRSMLILAPNETVFEILEKPRPLF